MVRALVSGVSRGTETLVFRGGVPPSQHAAMRAPFQEGDFPGPVKYGYLSVGVVEQGPQAVERDDERLVAAQEQAIQPNGNDRDEHDGKEQQKERKPELHQAQ